MKREKFNFVFLLIIAFCICCTKEESSKSPNQKAVYPSITQNAGCPGNNYGNWETSEFVLPYAIGNTYSVNLSHCSGSFHSAGEPDQFAIDFSMSVGTPITAAREGKVVHIEDSGHDFAFPNNLVVVQHSDGTFAQYMHLTHNGAKVKIGQNVIKGDLIGLSGATGLAGYPHLHFVVTKSGNWRYPYISLPKNFKNTTANEFSLRMGQSYTALPYE